MSRNRDPYEVLGIERDASAEDVKRAYRVKSKEHHPDRPQGDAAKMLEVRQAYDVLKDPILRAQFDEHGYTVHPLELRQTATALLAESFLAFIQQADDYMDVCPAVKDALSKQLANQRQQLKNLNLQLELLTKRNNQVRLKKRITSNNLFASICEQQMLFAKAAIRKCETIINAIPLALELLDEYESNPHKQREDMYIGSTSSTTYWTVA
jgi:curved DNA-binding protein CbpA